MEARQRYPFRLFSTFESSAVHGGIVVPHHQCGTKGLPCNLKGPPLTFERAPPAQGKHMENASEIRTPKSQRKLGHMLAIFNDLFGEYSPSLGLTIRKLKKMRRRVTSR
jgi:hypothetical protein